MMMKPRYIDRLKGHPGVPIALMMTLLMTILSYEGGIGGMVFGALASLIFWVPVLWTARDQPVSGDQYDD